MKAKKYILLLCLLLPATSLAKPQTPPVLVEYGVGDASRDITCTKPSRDGTNRLKYEAKGFLRKYKKSVLKEKLNKIVGCGKLQRGPYSWYRGTYVEDNKTIYVELEGGVDDTEYVLHHEFSSLLLWYSEKTTRAELEENWTRWSNRTYNLDHGKSDWIIKPRLQRDGFLYEYCLSSFENDFNTMATYYMSGYLRSNLEYARKKHRRINKKFKLLREFYRPLLR